VTRRPAIGRKRAALLSCSLGLYSFARYNFKTWRDGANVRNPFGGKCTPCISLAETLTCLGTRRRRVWLTPDEARTLLEACWAQTNARLADLAEMALYTGMRQGELLELTWSAVDRASGVIRVEQTKSGKLSGHRASRCHPGPPGWR